MLATKDTLKVITAGMIAIGDELLSGRTKDTNIGFLADNMTEIGIDLKEVRIIPDDESMIIETVNALRSKYDYIFTSGGIGPTHDDITAESISKAFNLCCVFDKRADAILEEYYKNRNVEYTQTRKMMTRMPDGAQLIKNNVSAAPGFIIENVYVMAGVPSVFQTMLLEVLPQLKKGNPYFSISIPCPFGEGMIGAKLSEIQQNNKTTIIGSYPKFQDNQFALEIVVRSRNKNDLDQAVCEVMAMILMFKNELR